MARSTARKRALNTLYEADEKNQHVDSLLAERIEYPGAQTPLPPYAIEICQGVADHYGTITRAINNHATNRTIGRMAVVDRNILRMGVWEIVFNDDVPDLVAIDEAAKLAGELSGEKSPSFVVGVLSAIKDDKAAILADDAEHSKKSDEAEEESEEEATEPTTAVGIVAPSAGARRATASDASGDWEGWDADYSGTVPDAADAESGEAQAADGSDSSAGSEAEESAEGAAPSAEEAGEGGEIAADSTPPDGAKPADPDDAPNS